MISAVSDRGQLVIPRFLREKYEIGKKTRIEWIDSGNGIVIIPLKGDAVRRTRGILEGRKNYLKSYLKDKKQEKALEREATSRGDKNGRKR